MDIERGINMEDEDNPSQYISAVLLSFRLLLIRLVFLHGDYYVGDQHNVGHDSCESSGVGGVALEGCVKFRLVSFHDWFLILWVCCVLRGQTVVHLISY